MSKFPPKSTRICALTEIGFVSFGSAWLNYSLHQWQIGKQRMPAHCCGSNEQGEEPEKYGFGFDTLVLPEKIKNGPTD
jgi:hypothetical protein